MASFSCSLIISWSKQPANFQSFTELDRGGIQNNSNLKVFLFSDEMQSCGIGKLLLDYIKN